MTSNLDLGRYVQRRQFRSFEQDMARGVYAYGVDVRRFRWLNQSMAVQTVMRALELRWDAVAEELMRGELQVPEGAVTLPFLQEIVRITELLRLTLPTVRLVAPAAKDRWPLVTVLGNARTDDDWLLLNTEPLAALAPAERAFLLGQALGHIQCGHTPVFMAHFVSHRDARGHLPVRLLLRPFSRLCAFSADRAGLLAAGEFEPAARMLERSAQGLPPWYPPLIDLAERRRALAEFDRTRVVARVRSSQRYVKDHPDVPELVTQLLQQELPEAEPDAPAAKEPRPAAREKSSRASRSEAKRAQQTPRSAAPEKPRPSGPEATAADPPPEYEVPADAWPLARCDQRLTQRLGIL